MGFEAGEVYAILGGRFSPKGFEAFNAAMNGSARSAANFERNIGRSMQNSSRSTESFGRIAKVAAQGGALVLAGGLAEAVKQAADFERSMRNVNSIATLAPKQFDKVRQSVLAMSKDTAQSPKVLADGLYQIYSSGIKGQGALKVLKASAVAASAGLTDTATSATAIVGALNAYHLSASSATKVSDELFQTVNRGVITFPQLAQTIGTVLPFANTLHIGLDKVGASISTLTKEGIPAAEATTYLKNAMVTFLKPSDDLTTAIKKTGSASGEALIKQKGFQGALQAVIGTTNGSKAAIAALFPDIRAQAAVFALTGSNAKTAADDIRGFSDANTKGAAAKVFAEQAKSAAFQLQQLKANLSEVAIEVGTAVLPMLNQGATALSKFLNAGAKNGTFAAVGADVKQGLGVAVEVIGDFVHVGGEVVGTVSQVAGALGRLAGVDLGNVDQVERMLEAVLGFKAAQAIVPVLASVSSGIGALALNARTAPSLAAFFAEIPVSPVTAAAVAVGGLVGALILLGGHESTESQLAKESASAHREQASAIRSVAAAEREAANKGLAAKQSDLDLKDAKKALKDARDARDSNTDPSKSKQLSEDVSRALLNERVQVLQTTEAHRLYNAQIEKQDKENLKRIANARGEKTTAENELRSINDQIALSPANRQAVGLPAKVSAQELKDQATAQAAVNDRVAAYYQAVARGNVSDISRNRLMNEASQIQDKNALGIDALADAIKGIPSKQQAQILLTGDQDALARLGNFIKGVKSVPTKKEITAILNGDEPVKVKIKAITALMNGVPPEKVAKILADTDGQGDKLAALQRKIDAMRGKTVQIQVDQSAGITPGNFKTGSKNAINPRTGEASGGGGHQRTSLVGEGDGPEWRVNPRTGEMEKITGPQFRRLSADDYIIPTDRKYRGRALGLIADLAAQMGIPAYKTGKSGSVDKKQVAKQVEKMPIPAKITYAAVDETSFRKTVDDERGDWKTRENSIDKMQKKLKANAKKLAAAKTTKAKGKIAAERNALVKDLHFLQNGGGPDKLHSAQAVYKAWQEDSRLLKKLHSENQRIERLNTQQENDRQKMANAAGAGNSKAYNAARDDRTSLLGQLRSHYETALKLVPKGSTIAATIDGLLQGVIGDQQDNSQTFEGAAGIESESDRFYSTGFTDDEATTEKGLEKNIALAALTADTSDDITAQNALTSFLQGVLNTDLGGRAMDGVTASDDAITSLAGLVKQAQTDALSLVNTPDLQAQLDQANARADAANANTVAAGQVLQAFTGSGDIGTGGFSSAYQAARSSGVTVNINTLHPGDPRVAMALAETTVRGISYQNPTASPRVETGA